MSDRKQYNSNLRPHSPKRIKQMQAGTLKPKPRTPLKAKSKPVRDQDDEYPPKRYTLRLGPNATGTFRTPNPDKRTIAILRKVIDLAMKKEAPRSTLNYKGGSVRAKLDDELMTLYSRFRRRSAAGMDGTYPCFICGKPIYWQDGVLMHYEARVCMPTRFHDIGTQPGCAMCNGKPNGDRPNFARKLDKAYGPGTADALTILSKNTWKPDRVWYREKIEFYKGELRKFGL